MDKTLTVAIDQDIIDLAERFVANRRDQKQDWRAVASAGDLEALRRLGHELKGTAGAFGFQALSEMAEHLETVVKQGDLKAAHNSVERMIDYLENVTIVPS